MDKLRRALSGQEEEEEERGFVAQVRGGVSCNSVTVTASISIHICLCLEIYYIYNIIYCTLFFDGKG